VKESCFEILVPRYEMEQGLNEGKGSSKITNEFSRGDTYKDVSILLSC
jgi:hypothetical protein